mmetsp:Transcript_24181/g.36247  ORF Transcript_24181/g.36247 Transcript_24181/m.36247 type:complete len:135 (+) Transcript_24181:44-448(+)
MSKDTQLNYERNFLNSEKLEKLKEKIDKKFILKYEETMEANGLTKEISEKTFQIYSAKGSETVNIQEMKNIIERRIMLAEQIKEIEETYGPSIGNQTMYIPQPHPAALEYSSMYPGKVKFGECTPSAPATCSIM